MTNGRDTWRSNLGFILATSGAAIGLGNVWRFPTMATLNGGGAFLVPYVALLFLVGVPAVLGEFALGRAASRGPVGAFRALAANPRWGWVGGLAVLTSTVILSYYSVVAGWCVAYVVGYLSGWPALVAQDALVGASTFAQVISTPRASIGWHGLFMALTAGVVIKGVSGGIERVNRVLMPLLLVLLILLIGQVLSLEGSWEGLVWFLTPRWADVTADGVMAALSQIFFSLSLGGGTLITFASYLPRRSDLPRNAVSIAAADATVAVLAGCMVIPALFAFQLPMESGPKLLFEVMTRVFKEMPATRFVGFLFFFLLSIAALTSAISLLEIWATTWIDERRWSRPTAALSGAAFAFALGIPSAVSQVPGSRLTLLGTDFLSALDFIASDLMLPVTSLLIVVFVGWVWGSNKARKELTEGARQFRTASLWEQAVRYILPVAIVLVMLGALVE